MRIAMIGTRGVPARYGGFETCIEEVGKRLVADGHEVTVFCRRGPDGPSPDPYLGMRTVTLPALRVRAGETLSHTALSALYLMVRERPDAAIVFNAANAPFLPLLRARGIPVATHVDGLEWRRGKWGRWGKTYYLRAERWAVRWSDALIADAQGIADYYLEKFDARTRLLTYGAPRISARPEALEELGLSARGYHLVVARFEPENHVAEIVEGYAASDASLPVVVVGDAPYAASYRARVRAAGDDRVRFLGSVWDQDLLDQLYANCFVYWHGHSVGGTNPSLLRALGAGAATCAYDVNFNREVLRESGLYWTTPADVRELLEKSEVDRELTLARGRAAALEAARYDWDDTTRGYAKLCADLACGREISPVTA
ncbi:glycosyltransferase [Knoellia koreensis]|jgi:glycosyltransferase involved in cell wall biosynthesis|uniref:D-inositol 3-phosphate glycosyltransferase n=1 Tax=Knoellia koreensis TaxID=2730921 RepID=A0A849HHG6_9MICO|nr:glycosyltransferase [Knoellia sp. DB2414S]NNM46672.1 glycosyltransferase [Knoellia sp. DB2414S]